MASSYGFTKFFVATLCLVGFCKITFKLDSYLASLGVNLGRPSAGMGAMGLIMAASRIISQIGRSGAGDGGSAPTEGSNTAQTSEGSMQEGFTEPIPMMPGNTAVSGMDMSEGSSEGDFDETPDISGGSGLSGAPGYPEQETADRSGVLEELGVVTSEKTEGDADPGIRTDPGIGIGRTETVGTETGIGAGRTETVETQTSSVLENHSGDNRSQVSGLEDGTSMDMSVSGIPEYTDEANLANGDGTANNFNAANGQAAENEIGMSVTESSESTALENGYGNSNAGIISEIGDYPIEEDFSVGADESVMELDGNTIESMGSGLEENNVSYGNAGDAFGNARLASSRASGGGTGFHANADGSRMPGIGSSGDPEGIIREVGADFEGGSIGNTVCNTGESSMELGGGSIAPYHVSETASGNRNLEKDTMRSDNDETGIAGGFDLSKDANGDTWGTGVDYGNSCIPPYETAAEEASRKIPEDGTVSGEHAADVMSGVMPSANQTGMYTQASWDAGMGETGTYDAAGMASASREEADYDMAGTASAGRKEAGYGMDGASAANQEEVSHMSEGMTMPGDGIAEEKPYMPGDKKAKLMHPENEEHGMKPVNEMDGQMNRMQSGGPIPAGKRKGERHRKPTREFREVPKTREELRRRQKEQKTQDEISHK